MKPSASDEVPVGYVLTPAAKTTIACAPWDLARRGLGKKGRRKSIHYLDNKSGHDLYPNDLLY